MRFNSILLLVIGILLITGVASAQIIEVFPDELDFGEVAVDDFCVLMLTITNTGEENWVHCFVEVSDVDHFRAQTRMAEAREAESICQAIANAALRYRQINGEDPHSVQVLQEWEYIWLHELLLMQWRFYFIGQNPINYVVAASTEEMPGGAGNIVVYDVHTRQFSGYGAEVDAVGIYLSGGQDRSIPVTFMPDQFEEFEANLNVFSRHGNVLDSITVEMHGIGVEREPSEYIEISPEALDFDDVNVGEVGELMLTVTNISQEDSLVLVIQSNDIAHFRIINPEALEARETILVILDGVIQFRQDHGEDPFTVQQLEEGGYIVIPEDIKRRWTFTLVGVNPIVFIEAISTDEMQGGAGHVIRYDIERDIFEGYETHGEVIYFDMNVDALSFRLLVRFVPDERGEFEGIINIWVGQRMVLELLDQRTVEVHGRGSSESVDENLFNAIPNKFCLLPAYPNPFNSTTTISYNLPFGSRILLGVYDPLGRSVKTLFEGNRQAGVYSESLLARDLTTGLYFVRLEASGQAFTRKVILIR